MPSYPKMPSPEPYATSLKVIPTAGHVVISMPEGSTAGNGDSLSGQITSGTDGGDTSNATSVTPTLDPEVAPFKVVDISLDGKQKVTQVDTGPSDARSELAKLKPVEEHTARLLFMCTDGMREVAATYVKECIEGVKLPEVKWPITDLWQDFIPFQRRSAMSLLDRHDGLLPLLRPLTDDAEAYMHQFPVTVVPISSRISTVVFKSVAKTSMIGNTDYPSQKTRNVD
jgi:hypothetical protein